MPVRFRSITLLPINKILLCVVRHPESGQFQKLVLVGSNPTDTTVTRLSDSIRIRRSGYTRLSGCSSNGKTSVLQAGKQGSIPWHSTLARYANWKSGEVKIFVNLWVQIPPVLLQETF